MVWKQTKRYCFNFFNQNFLEPDLRTYMKIVNKPKRSSFNTIIFQKVKCQPHLSETPGENCAVPGFSVLRKGKGISIFKVYLAINEFSKTWSRDLINNILKYRQPDKSLNERIESHKLFTCENILMPTRYMLSLLVNH